MDIPNDLNNLLAQLQQVTNAVREGMGGRGDGIRPSSTEVESFLRQHGFTLTCAEQIEISRDGVFESYMFAIQDAITGELSLLIM